MEFKTSTSRRQNSDAESIYTASIDCLKQKNHGMWLDGASTFSVRLTVVQDRLKKPKKLIRHF